jgi:tetratricopeptide (TPR) repeat protein
VTDTAKRHSYYSLGLLEELVEENRKKLAGDPDNQVFRSNLAVALYRLGRNEDAITEFRSCIQAIPTPENWNNLGKACLNAGHYEEALGAFREVLGKGKRWPDTLYYSALAHRGLEEPGPAETCLREAVTLNPRYREALNELGEILESLGRKDEALTEFKKVIALFFSEYQFNDPDNYKYDLTVLFDSPELVDESIRRLRDFVAKYPGFADAHYKLGLALEAKGLSSEAVISFRRALEINPRYETARQSFWKRK